MSKLYNYDGKQINVEAATAPALESHDYFIKSVCHKGYCQNGAIQNTLPAFKAAKANGYLYVEADLRATSDGVIVMSHDDDIASYVTSASVDSMLISANTYEDLAQYTIGSGANATTLLTFDQFVYWCKCNDVHPYLDYKSTSIYSNAIATINKYGMGNHVTHIKLAGALATAFPHGRFCGLGASLESCKSFRESYPNAHVFTDCNYANLTADAAQSYLAENIPVEVYTVNDANVVKKAVSYGVSGFTTDMLHVHSLVTD